MDRDDTLARIREDVAYCRAKIEAHNQFVQRLIALEESLASVQRIQGERISKLEGYTKVAFLLVPVLTGVVMAVVTAFFS